MSSWWQLDVRAIGSPNDASNSRIRTIERLAGECQPETRMNTDQAALDPDKRHAWRNYPASIDRCDLGTAAKVTPVKDMGTDRHHEEHEAWCALRRQKKKTHREKWFQVVNSSLSHSCWRRWWKKQLVVVLSWSVQPRRKILVVVLLWCYSPNFFHFFYCFM